MQDIPLVCYNCIHWLAGEALMDEGVCRDPGEKYAVTTPPTGFCQAFAARELNTELDS